MRFKNILWATAALSLGAGPALADDLLAAQAEIVVVGQRDDLLHIPGSGATIETEDLERARVFTVNEALRQAPGVYPRDEEGLGLRPNIGVRGLSPTRSTKVLLLEDGLPLTYAPYGDNATYSHPSLRRFERIEILKGASQIRFGPNSVGGVVNYITPDAPSDFGGELTLAAGDNGYREASGSIGGEVLGARLLAHGSHVDFDGVRDNHDLTFDDLFLKAERTLAPGHDLTARIGLARENSQVSYSGLTEAEYAADPYANPFPNDRFDTERYSASLTHGWRINDSFTLTSSAYSLYFTRDWWRQSSNSGQRPADSSDPTCVDMSNLETTCGNEGRLREYHHHGLESRLGWTGRAFGADVSAEFGARAHTERQNRLQINSDTPTGRTPGIGVNAGVREFSRRYADAFAVWATGAFDFGRLAISPGVRFESIQYERENIANPSNTTPFSEEETLEEAIPGLGLTYDLADDIVLYAGVHRGFAPPRVEDIISSSGGVVELDPEESTNWELGVRGEPLAGLFIDAALFRMDFDNQIVPASVAGGVGTTLTSAGETSHTGAELSLRGSLKDMGLMTRDDVFFRAALTYVGEAEYRGARFSNISGFETVSVEGNRLPYAPEWLASAAIGYAWGDIADAQIEVQHTGEQFSDDLNTIAPTENGQRGLIEDFTIVNLAANLRPLDNGTTFFVTVKNVFDETYIVDRARGILPGAPRLFQAGISVEF